ncbi:Dph6-related ATP pyrophosphatase [Alkaliphilus serpentinus]|uniref:Diphthine--ammonia ligase n=1 Tax=Alkaliphilus serpentinus TaxID=1482731 RepID=A0A833MCX6_9FIRM|nr:diphthine--ammonia ligase [Alkaliphilus serpentinus]KAB3526768.1 diphthine--ammonia ligase [Alkaliphilus serpentinus]
MDQNIITKNLPFFTSWSGGKDSTLAHYRALKNGGEAKALFTMFTEEDTHSRSHGLPKEVLIAQARSLNIPFVCKGATWQSYEEVFVKVLHNFKESGIQMGVFGDIDLDEHRQWQEKVCKTANVRPYLPLWKEERRKLLLEFINLGFKTMIIAAKDKVMPKSFLGKTMDLCLVEEIEKLGVDACGEEGEFHTVVYDGPIFSYPLYLKLGEKVLKNGYWFQEVMLK